jgi:FkbM family methyltransferase
MSMTSRLPLPARIAFFWNKHGLRAKSAVPRAIGRSIPFDDFWIPTRSGAKLCVERKNLDVYASIYNDGGRWDPHVMEACNTLLRAGDVFYDIGSNTGLFAIDFCYQHDSVWCYAFEAQPLQSDAIVSSIQLNNLKNAKCVSCLLGAQDGIGTLYLTSHSIHASIVPRESHYDEIELPMRTIDSLSNEGAIKDPDVIKIDVEGSEMNVFKGAIKTFSRSSPSIIFEADENMKRAGVDPNVLLALIRSFGQYKLFEISVSGALMPVADLGTYGNFLALAERHQDRLPKLRLLDPQAVS